jgi:invasion protein IalB
MSDVSKQRMSSGAFSRVQGNWGRIALRAGGGVLLLIAGGIITLAGERVLGGSQAPNETRITQFQDQDWRVTCQSVSSSTPNCALAEQVTGNSGVILTLSMTDTKPESSLSLMVPHGVMLEPGLGFTIGSEPMRVRPYETCTNVGCFALVTVDADTLKSLKSNMGGVVALAAPNAPQPVSIPFSLKGFSDAYSELQRAQARRTGLLGFFARS